MDFYEADLIKTQTVMKELEENPGRRLKSFKIYLEKKAELRKEQIEALHQGKLLMDIDPHMPTFFRAMGFLPYDGNAASNPRHGAISPSMSHAAYKEKAQAL
ncbi:MAG: hypothetical protein PHU23_17810, partial [Dehalococcoidales bacterium]|nr:hypothetical protein [Dehalococcoidales bacterium]